MSTPRKLKWLSAGLEVVLGIPFIGAIIILKFLWLPLVLMFGLHIITLILSRREGLDSGGSILGIITSCLGWIPFLGMLLHWGSAVCIVLDAEKAAYQSKNHY